MLQSPTEFGVAVQALVETQKQAIAAGIVFRFYRLYVL